MSSFVFLPGDDESANDRLARFHEEFLGPGPSGWVDRAEDFRWLMEHFLPPVPWKQKGTTCALYQGAALMAVGAQVRRPVPAHEKPKPKAYAITTWVKFHFGGEEWIPVERIKSGAEEIIRGDLPYWSNTTSGVDGHIGCVRTGEGFTWSTAEGGGGLPKGTCKLSDGAKDILLSHGRHLRGVVRPNLMASVILPRPSVHDTKPDGFLELRRGMRGPRVGEWQTELLRLRYELPRFGADSDFGGETEAATRAFQIRNTIPNTGIVDRRTFDTARAMEK